MLYDSRSGSEEIYELSDLAAQILGHLSRRKSVVELRDTIREVTETELLDELARLMERNLIFDEEDRYLSLVLRQKTDWAGDQLLLEQAVTAGSL
jgi:predicted transcriptional regulator